MHVCVFWVIGSNLEITPEHVGSADLPTVLLAGVFFKYPARHEF